MEGEDPLWISCSRVKAASLFGTAAMAGLLEAAEGVSLFERVAVAGLLEAVEGVSLFERAAMAGLLEGAETDRMFGVPAMATCIYTCFAVFREKAPGACSLSQWGLLHTRVTFQRNGRGLC